MHEECLICKAKLEYLAVDELMQCAICRKTEPSKTRCVNGHYVCSNCHTQGMDSIFGLCFSESSRDPRNTQSIPAVLTQNLRQNFSASARN